MELAIFMYVINVLTINGPGPFFLALLLFIWWGVKTYFNKVNIPCTSFIALENYGGVFNKGNIVTIHEVESCDNPLIMAAKFTVEGASKQHIAHINILDKDNIFCKALGINTHKNSGKPWLAIIIWCYAMFMPNRETALYIGGAYIVQSVLESKEVKTLGKEGYQATLSVLKSYSKDSKDLENLLKTTDIIKQ